jgi:hypothetical protein
MTGHLTGLPLVRQWMHGATRQQNRPKTTESSAGDVRVADGRLMKRTFSMRRSARDHQLPGTARAVSRHHVRVHTALRSHRLRAGIESAEQVFALVVRYGGRSTRGQHGRSRYWSVRLPIATDCGQSFPDQTAFGAACLTAEGCHGHHSGHDGSRPDSFARVLTLLTVTALGVLELCVV